MTKRTCSLPECDRAHRARGLCASHYNQTHLTKEKRHPCETTACVACATPVVRRVGSIYRPTCSVACRTIVQHGEASAQASAFEWRADAKSRARKHGCRIVDDFDRVVVFDRDDWTCYLCGVQCHEPDPFDVKAATVDHVIPFLLGGDHAFTNVRTACLSCNSAKAARAPETVAI